MLSWIDLPSAALVPRVRAFIFLLEAVFTILFHACIEMMTDQYVDTVLLFPRTAVEWDPLCSHLSSKEILRSDWSLTDEELELAAAMRNERAK